MKSYKKIIKHFSTETRKILKNKFLIVLVIVIGYFIFATLHFGIKDGFSVMLLTWSFFVLATPVTSGGIILDLPIRYFAGIRMIISEIYVWAFAILVNVFFLYYAHQLYYKTFLLTIFRDILMNPFPYWLIIILSGVGTFMSLYFGDELYDVIKHKHREKYKNLRTLFKGFTILSVIIFVVILYEILLTKLGVKLL